MVEIKSVKKERTIFLPVSTFKKLCEKFTSPGVILTYIALKSFADRNGHCNPLISTLMEMTKTKERTIQDHIKELKKYGFIRVKLNKGHSASDYYLLVTERGVDSRASTNQERHAGNRASEAERGADSRERGAVDRGVNSYEQLKSFNNTDGTEKKKKNKSLEKATKSEDFEANFEEVYRAYPQKGRKQRARDQYKAALKLISHAELLKAVKDYNESPYVQSRINDPENKKYIPLFVNWLKDCSWEAEERDRWNNAAPGWKPPEKKYTADEQREIIRGKIRAQIFEELAECMKIVTEPSRLLERMGNRPDVYDRLRLIDGTTELSAFVEFAAGLGVKIDG